MRNFLHARLYHWNARVAQQAAPEWPILGMHLRSLSASVLRPRPHSNIELASMWMRLDARREKEGFAASVLVPAKCLLCETKTGRNWEATRAKPPRYY